MEREIIKQPTVSDYVATERKKWVLNQYLSGRYPYEIREEYIELYKVGKHSFDSDVIWVNQQLRKQGEQDIEGIIQRHTDYYYDIYRLSKEKMDYRSATNALRNIEDLYKLHKPATSTSLHLTNKTTYNFDNLSFDQLKELMELGKNPVLEIGEKSGEQNLEL